METTEMVQKLADFIEATCRDVVLENARKGKLHYTIDFGELARFDPEMADAFLDEPEESLTAARLALDGFDLPSGKKSSKRFQVLIKNLPAEARKLISGKRTKHIDRLLYFEGIIRAKSPVLSRAQTIKFECPNCGNVIKVLQTERSKVQPTKCGCGRKGKFRLLEKDNIDVQKVELEELPENVKGTSQPQRLKVLLKGFLVDPGMEPKFNPGAKVRMTGILREMAIQLRNGSESVDSDFILEASHIENIEEEDVDSEISAEEMERIEEIAKDSSCIDTLVRSIVPSIYGHDRIKEGILLQLVGGVRKIAKDGTIKRGDVHVLIIGDPGAGKSSMLKRIEVVIPHARVATGKGSSGVGLTAAVVRDEFMGWTFQAGTLVLAHKNVAIIDEFDKMTKEDRDQIHEALEQQTVTIAKAQVQARLSCECALLAGANPKYGRFDPYAKSLADQIDLPPTIINRFDLIFPVTDTPKPESDEMVAKKVLGMHTDSEDDGQDDVIETPLLRKYLNCAKALSPFFTRGASDYLVKYYLKIRGRSGGPDGIKTVPISARQLEGLIRLSEGYAKLRLSKKVRIEDAKRAVALMDYCLKQVAFDNDSGTVDIDIVSSGLSADLRGTVSAIERVMADLESESGRKVLLLDDVLIAADEKGLKGGTVKKAIDQMNKKGDVFFPKPGHIMRGNY